MTWLHTIEELNALHEQTEILYVSGRSIKSLTFVNRFKHLKELYLHSFKAGDLANLKASTNLKILVLENVDNGADLDPISNLQNLEEFVLQTPTGRDGSGKRIRYKSVKPLEKLKNLKKLTTLDVIFDEDGLSPLYNIGSLSEFNTTNTFTTEAFAKLNLHRPDINCAYANPYRKWEGFEFYKCKKCNAFKVEFSDSDLKARTFCLNCNRKKSEELIGRFEKFKRS